MPRTPENAPANVENSQPSVQPSPRRVRVIKRWHRMRTLLIIKVNKRKRACTHTATVPTTRCGSSPSNILPLPRAGTTVDRRTPPIRKPSTIEIVDTVTLTQTRVKLTAKCISPTGQEIRVNSEFVRMYIGLPLERFHRAARLLKILLRVSRGIIRSSRDTHRPELGSLADFQDELDGNGALRNSGLVFDPTYFKVKKEVQLSTETKRILTQYPSERSSEDMHMVLIALKNAVQAFGEFPIKMQESIARVGWYESFDAKRIIIRQGHTAESFYLILSGTAVVTVSSPDPVTSEPNIRTVAFLKRGNSFGELALMHHSTRNATVSCKDLVELLSIDREDFTDIFMHRNEGVEPEFIRYLRTVDELKDWPVHRLPHDDPSTCLFTYFRRGVVICKDSNNSEWIYVIKTGTCRVLKKLRAPKRLFKARADLIDVFYSLPQIDKYNDRVPSSPTHDRRSCSRTSPERKPNHKEYRRPSRYTKLPNIIQPIRAKSAVDSVAQINESPSDMEDKVQAHINLIQDKLEQTKFEPQECSTPSTDKNIFLQVQKLIEKDTFGLKPLVFGQTDGAPSVTLVSEGAECVLISKRFFLHNLSEEHRKSLRKTLRPYPSDQRLQEQLQEQTDWDEFKCHEMQRLIDTHGKKSPLSNFTL